MNLINVTNLSNPVWEPTVVAIFVSESKKPAMKLATTIVLAVSALFAFACFILAMMASGGVLNWLRSLFRSPEVIFFLFFPPTGWAFFVAGVVARYSRSHTGLWISGALIAFGVVSSWYFLFLLGADNF